MEGRVPTIVEGNSFSLHSGGILVRQSPSERNTQQDSNNKQFKPPVDTRNHSHEQMKKKDKGGMMKLQEDPEAHGQSIREEKVQRTPKAQSYAPRRPEMLTTDFFL